MYPPISNEQQNVLNKIQNENQAFIEFRRVVKNGVFDSSEKKTELLNQINFLNGLATKANLIPEGQQINFDVLFTLFKSDRAAITTIYDHSKELQRLHSKSNIVYPINDKALNRIKSEQDEDNFYSETVENFYRLVNEYTFNVTTMDAEVAELKLNSNLSGNDLTDAIRLVDSRRSSNHNAIIRELNLMQRWAVQNDWPKPLDIADDIDIQKDIERDYITESALDLFDRRINEIEQIFN
jgi:hypothetical protein